MSIEQEINHESDHDSSNVSEGKPEQSNGFL